MSSPVTKTGFGDARLADRIVEAYADGHVISTKYLGENESDFTSDRSDILLETLMLDSPGEVTPEEKQGLASQGFSQEFIDALAGPNGLRSMEAAIKRVKEKANSRLWPLFHGSEDKMMLFYQFDNYGEHAVVAIPEIIKVLGGGSENERVDAVWMLGWMGPAASAALYSFLEDPSKRVRLGAIFAIGQTGDASYETILALCMALSDDYAIVSAKAADALGGLGAKAKGAVPDLIRRLKDARYAVRLVSMIALGRIGPDAAEAVPALIDALDDPDVGLRIAAAEALGRIGPAARVAIPKLTKFVTNKSESAELYNPFDPMHRESLAAINTLEDLGADVPAVMHELERLLRIHKYMRRGGNQADPSGLFKTIGRFGPRAAALSRAMATILAEQTSLNFYVQLDSGAMIDALSKIGPVASDAVPILMEAVLQGVLDNTQRNAVLALGAIGIPGIAALIFALQNEESLDRINAAKALLSLGEKARLAIPYLYRMREYDPEPGCQAAAAAAIKEIESKVL